MSVTVYSKAKSLQQSFLNQKNCIMSEKLKENASRP